MFAVCCISRQWLFDFPAFFVEPALLEITIVVGRIPLTKLALEHNLCTHEDSSAHTQSMSSPNMIPDFDMHIAYNRESPKKQYTGDEGFSALELLMSLVHCKVRQINKLIDYKLTYRHSRLFLMIHGDPT